MTALTTCRLLGFTPQAVEPLRVESMQLGAHWFVVLYTAAERGKVSHIMSRMVAHVTDELCGGM